MHCPKLRTFSVRLERRIGKAHEASLTEWKQAVKLEQWGTQRQTHLTGRDWSEEWAPAVRTIRSALRAPAVRLLSGAIGLCFYSVTAFGTLNAINRGGAMQRKRTLQAGLRQLFDETKPEVERLDAVLEPSGEFHISGVGINVVSKILAVHAPKRLADLQQTRWEVALRHFGYRAPRGATRGARVPELRQVDAPVSTRHRGNHHAGARPILLPGSMNGFSSFKKART